MKFTLLISIYNLEEVQVKVGTSSRINSLFFFSLALSLSLSKILLLFLLIMLLILHMEIEIQMGVVTD